MRRTYDKHRLFYPLQTFVKLPPLVLGVGMGLSISSMTVPAIASAAPPAYTLFESGQVRPLALSPDGEKLFALNTPNGTLEIFEVDDDEDEPLEHIQSVPVGLEPVALAVRSNSEVWVVNHLSDSIGIVQVGKEKSTRVVRTLQVGDEPRDIVFAGPSRSRAFITTARRGQNSPVDPAFLTPSVGRANVWVFDANNLGSSLGGTPLTILTLFSDTPRALTVSPDGTKVYAAAFHSGNRTATVAPFDVPHVAEEDGGLPYPHTNHAGIAAPDNGLIVRYDGLEWLDELGRAWNDKIHFSIPDRDVFVIDAQASPPAAIAGSAGSYSTVGTILYNMATNPATGAVYVSNTEALNDVRFEGAGEFADTTVRGHFVENRITVLKNGVVSPIHLNKHIDYESCCDALPNDENAKSLALPTQLIVDHTGETLYVAAMGSDKIGVYDTWELEHNTFTPNEDDQIPVSGGGPTGLVLDEANHRLYVLTRFDNAISVINLPYGVEVDHLPLYNPEPASTVTGRRFLYNAALTSSHGDQACGSCHVFGDMDDLAWDLGDPDGDMLTAPGPFAAIVTPGIDFHPMKGPMTTQSLRGMANHGAMHWRGDRNGGLDAPSAQPNGGSFDEQAAFKKFNPAFVGLLGRDSQLTAEQMQAFTDFALELTYPPNPVRALNNVLTADQQVGHDAFFNRVILLNALKCVDCHTTDLQGNASYGVSRPGFFGTQGLMVMGEFPQTMKVPHLRNLYQKVGMYGMGIDGFFNPFGDGSYTGDQIRGFGYTHDGTFDTAMRFISNAAFTQTPDNPTGLPGGSDETLRRQIHAFLMAFDNNVAPIVGQQTTLDKNNGSTVGPRIDLLVARAAVGECELIVKGNLSGKRSGYLYSPQTSGGVFLPDRSSKKTISDADLRKEATKSEQELTYTCVPPGSGRRMGIDQDLDGILNGDEK